MKRINTSGPKGFDNDTQLTGTQKWKRERSKDRRVIKRKEKERKRKKRNELKKERNQKNKSTGGKN